MTTPLERSNQLANEVGRSADSLVPARDGAKIALAGVYALIGGVQALETIGEALRSVAAEVRILRQGQSRGR